MSDFESDINKAIADQELAGCVLLAANRDGSFKYTKTFGNTSMDPARAKPLGVDTVMFVASCTKLMTSISALQLVERGLITLDEPIYKYIPELEARTIITGFEEATGKPIEEKHKTPITLRALLTHTSGLAYDAMHPKVLAWGAYHKKPVPVPSGKLLERFSNPMVFEAGEGWTYGTGIDYAGLLIERISGKTLEEYMKENLWGPLGITDMTFSPKRREDLKERLADMSVRDESGKVRFTDAPMPYLDPEGGYVSYGMYDLNMALMTMSRSRIAMVVKELSLRLRSI